MNVFVLSTGRCGSTTFARASSHIRNFTAYHESRSHMIGRPRFDFSSNHIEVDNRLAWKLGLLDELFGKRAFYVHLFRDREATAQSFVKRWDYGIMYAYRTAIIMGAPGDVRDDQRLDFCRDYCDTVNANIRSFLKDKPRKLQFCLESAKKDWRQFWNQIGAQGELDRSLLEWDIRYNAYQ